MKIEFSTRLEGIGNGEYIEEYRAEVQMDDDTVVVLQGDETEMSYDAFKANIFQDLLEVTFDELDEDFEVFEEFDDVDLDDVMFLMDEDEARGQGLNIVEGPWFFYGIDSEDLDKPSA